MSIWKISQAQGRHTKRPMEEHQTFLKDGEVAITLATQRSLETDGGLEETEV